MDQATIVEKYVTTPYPIIEARRQALEFALQYFDSKSGNTVERAEEFYKFLTQDFTVEVKQYNRNEIPPF